MSRLWQATKRVFNDKVTFQILTASYASSRLTAFLYTGNWWFLVSMVIWTGWFVYLCFVKDDRKTKEESC